MAEYEFTVIICGTVVAYSIDEARDLLISHPADWGEVTIDELVLSPNWDGNEDD